jgi:hypothetical protein
MLVFHLHFCCYHYNCAYVCRNSVHNFSKSIAFVLIEVDTEEDIEALQNQKRGKCGDRLETNVQKRRNPRLIIYNAPDEITLENAADIICKQNPELELTKGDITTIFIFKNKRNTRNLVIEIDTKTYRIMRQNKLKIGWMICHLEYYVSVSRLLCILIVVYVFLDAATLTEGFPCFFLGCKANARV